MQKKGGEGRALPKDKSSSSSLLLDSSLLPSSFADFDCCCQPKGFKDTNGTRALLGYGDSSFLNQLRAPVTNESSTETCGLTGKISTGSQGPPLPRWPLAYPCPTVVTEGGPTADTLHNHLP